MICVNCSAPNTLTMEKTDLSEYNKGTYHPGAGWLKRICWYLTNIIFLVNPLNPFYCLKRGLLRLYGAKIGKKVIVKPWVSIKYPWNLEVGNHVWIGEHVWIDNLAKVFIGDNTCISQGAMIMCGNHNFSKRSFDLMVEEIHILEGAWIGAKSIVTPGVQAGSHSVLTAGSVAVGILEPYGIYQGNPAIFKKKREIKA